MAEIELDFSLAARLENDVTLESYHGEQALAIAREIGQPQLMAHCLNRLSYVYSNLRQWEMVEACASDARQLYAAAGNLILAADSQLMLGWAKVFSGHPQESLAT